MTDRTAIKDLLRNVSSVTHLCLPAAVVLWYSTTEWTFCYWTKGLTSVSTKTATHTHTTRSCQAQLLAQVTKNGRWKHTALVNSQALAQTHNIHSRYTGTRLLRAYSSDLIASVICISCKNKMVIIIIIKLQSKFEYRIVESIVTLQQSNVVYYVYESVIVNFFLTGA